ncbi:MAG: kelch repeat-containing protein [Chloroflexota bacterium]
MPEPGETLSDREMEVLSLLPSGASNKSIAEELSISPYTVKTHLRNIFAKLEVSSRTEAITVAMQQGMLAVPGDATLETSNGAGVSAPANEAAPAPVDTSPSPDAGPAPRRSPWVYLVPALLGLLALIAGVYWFAQWQAGRTALPEPLFAEEPIGETRWSVSRPLPESRVSQAIASIGLDIYQIGGETAEGVVPDVWVYDTASRLWHEAADKPTAVADATAAELFGEIYVPGGRLPDGQLTDVVEAYSPSQDAWRRIAPLPQPLSNGLAVAEGGFLYVIGGQGEDGVLDTVYVYDPGADSWRPVSSLPEPRTLTAGASLTGQIYVVGGTDGDKAQATCYTYNPALTVGAPVLI